jgi:hypothetical protein
MSNKELLSEVIIEKQGAFEKVKRWYKGWDLALNGTFINGITGKETETEETVIKPSKTFYVN